MNVSRVVWLTLLAVMIGAVPVGLVVQRIRRDRAARASLRRLRADRLARLVAPDETFLCEPPPNQRERRAMRE